MRKFEPMEILVRGTQLLLLILAFFLVVCLMPDTGKKHLNESETSEAESDSDSGASGDEAGENEADSSSSGKLKNEDETQEILSDNQNESAKAGGKSRHKNRKNTGSGAENESDVCEEAAYEPPVVWLATDLHYQSPKMTDFQSALETFTAGYDGTVVPYLDEITEAFLEEVQMERPSVLILSGDLSQNGEKVNHEELAKKLARVQAAGIQVLVIPGNHDINHPWSSSYFEDKATPAQTISSEEFYEIYHQFGYDQAASRAPDSLSYVYHLDEKYWVMMLDSCMNEPVHETGGKLSEETVSWMRTQLEEAKNADVTVIPVAHHNLLDESTLYPEECTIENSKEVTALLEEYGVPVYLSGHLHLQRIQKHTSNRKNTDAYGITEIVTSPLPMSPCQYSVLEWQEDGSLSYHTKKLDVAAWAMRYGEEDENLLHFDEYAKQFMENVISAQTFGGLQSASKEIKEKMAKFYADMNSDYCSGIKIDVPKVKKSEIYQYWIRYSGNDFWVARLKEILHDATTNNMALELKAGVDFPSPGEIPENKEDTDNAVPEADSPAKEIEARALAATGEAAVKKEIATANETAAGN